MEKVSIAFSSKRRSARQTYMPEYLVGSLRFGSSEVLQNSASRRRGLFLPADLSLIFHFPVACGGLHLFLLNFSMYFDIQPQVS